MNITARDMIRADQERKNKRLLEYDRQFERCLDDIRQARTYSKDAFIIFEAPLTLIEYECEECVVYLKDRLFANGFYCKRLKPGNRLFVSWEESLVAQLEERVLRETEQNEQWEREKERVRAEYQESEKERASAKVPVETPQKNVKAIKLDVKSPLSRLAMTKSLIMENASMQNLQSVKLMKNEKNKKVKKTTEKATGARENRVTKRKVS